MTTTHTKGRLLNEGGELYAENIGFIAGYEVAIVDHAGTDFPPDVVEANASRMVACWNVCDGLSTETLNSMPGQFFKPPYERLREVEAERDQLLAGKHPGLIRTVRAKTAAERQRDQLLKALEAIRANEDADGDVLREQAHSAIEAYEDDARARRLGLRGEASTSAPAPGKLPGNATN